MTSVPDPDPANTPGLTAGGSVPPGETPPAEAGTSGLSHHEAPPGRAIPVIAIVAIVVVVLLVLLFILGRAIDL